MNIFPQPIPSSTIDDEIFRLMHCFALVPTNSDDCFISFLSIYYHLNDGTFEICNDFEIPS